MLLKEKRKMKSISKVVFLLCLTSILALSMASCNESQDAPNTFEGESTSCEETTEPPFLEGESTICEETTEPHFHLYGIWKIIKEPTLNDEGVKERTCSECGHRKEEAIPPLASQGLAYEINEDGKTCTITGRGTCTDGILKFPSIIDGYRVTSIGEEAFYYDSGKVSRIVIPEGIEYIEEDAFGGCFFLSNVQLPNSLLSIGDYAFGSCADLVSIELPENLENLGRGAFDACYGLETVNIPKGITQIGDCTFRECRALAEIVLHDGITSIGHSAFYDCSSLISITIPNGVTEILISTFASCNALQTVRLPDTLKSIGNNAFADCLFLTDITLPNGLESIGDGAFDECYRLENIAIPSSVTHIGSDAFAACGAVQVVNEVFYVGDWAVGLYDDDLSVYTLQEGTVGVADCLFSYGIYLKNVTIPDSVKYVGRHTFFQCIDLNQIVFGGTKEQWGAIEKHPDWDITTRSYTVHCTEGDIEVQNQ
jgi:hypothetical protein